MKHNINKCSRSHSPRRDGDWALCFTLRDLPEIPNDMTLKAFAEDKKEMPVFETIQELREDLLS